MRDPGSEFAYRGILVKHDELILFSVKRELNNFFFVTRNLTVLHDA